MSTSYLAADCTDLSSLCELVEHRVRRYQYRYSLGSLYEDDLIGAGQLKLAEFLVDGKLTHPIGYVTTAIDHAISLEWQKSHPLAIPPNTRRGMLARGEEPKYPEQCPMDEVQRSLEWNSSESHYIGASRTLPRDWQTELSYEDCFDETSEALEAIQALCRDDVDRQLIAERLGNQSVEMADLLPVHVKDVARKVGISVAEAERRLSSLEERIYRSLDRLVPEMKRSQQPLLA